MIDSGTPRSRVRLGSISEIEERNSSPNWVIIDARSGACSKVCWNWFSGVFLHTCRVAAKNSWAGRLSRLSVSEFHFYTCSEVVM